MCGVPVRNYIHLLSGIFPLCAVSMYVGEWVMDLGSLWGHICPPHHPFREWTETPRNRSQTLGEMVHCRGGDYVRGHQKQHLSHQDPVWEHDKVSVQGPVQKQDMGTPEALACCPAKFQLLFWALITIISKLDTVQPSYRVPD